MTYRLGLAWLLIALGPVPAAAQSAGKVARIGWLSPEAGPVPASFREALRELGYVEGRTLAFEVRNADGDPSRLPELAAELIRSKVDVIVAISFPAIRAAGQATSTIPVVMRYGGVGLLESGLVASLARPGGNVTGIHMLSVELDGKRLELLLQAVPRARKVAVLDPGWPLSEVRRVAEAARIQLHVVEVEAGPHGYERAFEALTKARDTALLVPSSPRFTREARRIIELAAKRRIPTMYHWAETVEEGGLIAYGPIRSALDRRVAAFVDRILKGARPADLPIEQPTTFELVINLRTARALGLTVPPAVLQRADRVIE